MIPIGNTPIRSADDFARALRTRRQELEITQEELAAATGVNRRVIGELERGKGTVRLEIVLALAQALGLDVELRPRT
ncbi:helix-turn-helix domain-containing protein [Conexibacter sp. JD483]|uniref:helix-turn-helix transcriptional regulator n=1 Tax=unclassified Conexibacter TaxID=2627773 RepID=UPI002716DF50|nr:MULTISPECIES: helix-turn-helix domain-containing protein [unclassified Conexibacter]MDO8185250.1 helix-turn-helix domain-containing protein [Conexibacter sp. CPCC 205706]MDO8198296.1 helix-turn-helix domain-containing protein [Conexibacter sp. CPCC 205762]MDR9367743.1 helix-turn-helix domain-containing protein [Conexibacter sp. JD483]